MINNRKLFKNSIYSLGGKVVNMIVNFGGMAILARLISPEEFGVFAIILSVQMLFQAVLDMGLGPVYVKSRTITTAFVSSFFTINVILGLLNVIYLLGSIFILDYLYENINFAKYIILFSFSVVFLSLGLIYQFHLVRGENFDKIFFVNVISNILSLVIAIGVAYYGYGVLALILKAVSVNFFNLLLLYFYNRELKITLVKLKIIKRYMNEIRFGFEIFINRVMNGLFNSLDRLIIAKFYSISILGNYNNAKNLVSISDLVIRTSLSSVIFSHLEKNPEKKQNYIKYYFIILVISSIFPLILFLWGDNIILFWLGDKWQEASLFIKPLAIFAVGDIIKGVSTMIAMHENNMKSINIFNLFISILMILTLFVGGIIHISIVSIILIVSILWFTGWGIYFLKVMLYISKGME